MRASFCSSELHTVFDRLLHQGIQGPLQYLARGLHALKVSPNTVTLLGFAVGLGVIPALYGAHYGWAAVCVAINRLLDGLDGPLARLGQPSELGAYLDIVADMLFYGAFVFGMALAQPENAVWSALVLFSFMGTSSAFFADALFAEKQAQQHPEIRGIRFLSGLIEGTETLIFMLLVLRFWFIYKLLAIAFAALCFLTVLGRVWRACLHLRPTKTG